LTPIRTGIYNISIYGYIKTIMQDTNLPLFTDENFNQLPQKQIINQPNIPIVTNRDNFFNSEQKKNPEQLFNNFFLEASEQTKTVKARQIIGKNSNDITDEELESFTAKLDYLTNSWLDSYEKQLFNGKTIRELTKSDMV
jgi:hypothetical protein